MTSKKLPASALYKIESPGNLYKAMRHDVKLLYERPAYTTCATAIVCFIDTLAAGGGEASSGKFTTFLDDHFPDLCGAF